MIKRVFYNASFPRSGSTLLQNVLGQNPDIFPSPTSGMFTMMLECRNLFTNHILFQAQNQDELLPGFSSFLKNGINGYYSGLTDKPYAIDKFRGWHGEYNFVNAYDPNPKIVVMVRDLRSIFSSMEKKYRANPLKDFNVTDYKFPKGNSVITRIDDMAQKPMLDLPLENLYIMKVASQSLLIHSYTILKGSQIHSNGSVNRQQNFLHFSSIGFYQAKKSIWSWNSGPIGIRTSSNELIGSE